MSKAADAPRPNADPGRFWMRAGLLASVLAMALVIWASHIYLSRAFSVDQETDATVRATLYGGSIQSSMQRHSVVPLLLSRDPILILALRSGEYAGAEERLASFRDEIGAGSIFLLDAEGRIVAASDERPREQYDGDNAYFTLATADTGTVFSIIENDDGAYSFHYARRIMQEEQLLGVVVVTVDLGQHEEGWRRAGSKVVVTDSDDQVLLASEPNWRKQTLANLRAAGPDPSRVRQAIRDARRSIGAPAYAYIAGTPLPRRRGAGRVPQLAPDLLRHARGRARAGQRGPVADHHGARAPARARLLPALPAHPRREPAHPARIRGAARAEPAALAPRSAPESGWRRTSRRPSRASSRPPSSPHSGRCRRRSATSSTSRSRR